MYITSANANSSKKTVESCNAFNVISSIIWLSPAERINAASSAQINIILKSAQLLQTKDAALIVTRIMNFEDTSVSSNNSRWNKHSNSIEINHLNTQKHSNIIMYSCSSWILQWSWTFQIYWIH